MTPLSRTFRAAALLLGASLAAQGTPTLLVDVEALAPDNPGAFSQPGRMSGLTWGSYLDFAADADGTGLDRSGRVVRHFDIRQQFHLLPVERDGRRLARRAT